MADSAKVTVAPVDAGVGLVAVAVGMVVAVGPTVFPFVAPVTALVVLVVELRRKH